MSHLTARRVRLMQALSISQPVAFFAGTAPTRNFKAQVYPFRASSHFLYFAGCSIEGAVLTLQGDSATLYIPEKDPNDPLWHGPAEPSDVLAQRVGCAVRPLKDFQAAAYATLPVVSPLDRKAQEDLLGRPVPTSLKGPDRALALAVIAVRLEQDDAALEGIRAAVEATTEAFRDGMRATQPELREWVVRAAMEAAVGRRGMTTSYEPIVSTRGEILHNRDSSYTMSSGDLLLVDFGAESRGGWASDVTRTWPVSGSFSSTQKALYEVVLTAQKEAIERATVGMRMLDLHRGVCLSMTRGLVALGILSGDPEELVADGVHALLFPHGLGHLLGLDVHDMEDLGDLAGYALGRTRSSQFGLGYLRMDRDLAPGMVITIEPGLYCVPAILERPDLTACARGRLHLDVLEKFSDVRGIRIEDDVLVTADGPVNLTVAIPKEVGDVEAAVGG